MRISEHLKLFSILAVSAFMTGCILPLPHTRVVRPECEGFVSDAITGRPISNATVVVVYEGGTNIVAHTDPFGRWMIPGEKSWHAVAIAAPPAKISLLPRFGGCHLPYMITIEADGYDKCEGPYWVIDRRNVQLKPKVM